MDIGVATFPTHDAMSPGAMARLVEERGFEALLFAEHTHIPASDHPRSENGEDLPRKYWHTYDTFVAMTAAAMATSRLRVGSSICLVIERDAIITAKEVASIDHMSGGRVDLGVGAGWNRQEMVDHGTDPVVRMAVLAERVQAMKAIWAQDEPASTASTCRSGRSGPGRSRRSALTHRSLSAATAPCARSCPRLRRRVVPQLRAA